MCDLKELMAGFHVSQLIFTRSIILFAEILVATLNALTVHVVKLALGDLHKRCCKLMVVRLRYTRIESSRSALKLWVRNRVVKINRLADANLWRYVESKDMCTDLGTRK